MISQSRIQIFNRAGVPLAEVDTAVKRGWLLNKDGECDFLVPFGSPAMRRSYLDFGNLVLVTNDAIAPWVGVIEVPRQWKENGVLVHAVSAERLFDYRSPDKVGANNIIAEPVQLEGKVGNILQILINLVNEDEDTLLRPGQIWLGGKDRKQTLKSGSHLKHLNEVIERADYDWCVTPDLANNILGLKVNLYQKRGADKSAMIVLEESFNITLQSLPYEEQGRISNQIVGVSDSSVAANRKGAVHQNAASRARFGLRQDSVVFNNVADYETLDQNTLTEVNAKAYPRGTARVTITDTALFSQIEPGDTVHLILHSAGFLDDATIGLDAPVRILGMELDDAKGTLDIVVNEINGG